jgi:hypothetical protein
MSAPATPTQSNASHRHSAVLEVPLDIPQLKESLDRLITIYKPVILNKYHPLSASDRREATKVTNAVTAEFLERWGVRWDDSFGKEHGKELNYMNCDVSKFPEKVRLDMEKHVSMKEFQLVRLLNTDLANMIATQSYLTFFPSDFLPADTQQIRMFNWIELNDVLKLRLTSDSLQLAHSKDLKDVMNLTSFKWRRAFAYAVGHIAHMRRLFFQICSASNTFVRRTLVIPSPGKLVKTGSNVSSESQTLLNSELELLRDKTRQDTEDLAKHCGIRPEGIYCTDCLTDQLRG